MFLYTTKITDKHHEFIAKKIREQINSSTTMDELHHLVYNTMSKMFLNAYSPLMIRRYISGIPNLDHMNSTMEECIYDIESVSIENQNIAESLKTHFNERQNQKNNMINKVKLLNNTIDDAMFLNDQLPAANTMIFRDSFTTTDQSDLINTEGIPAEVSTKEGVVRLNVTSVENLSSTAKINKIDGTGELGNAHMVELKVNPDNTSICQYSQTLGDDPAAMFDDQPNTYFEFSSVGVSDADKLKTKYYDIDWATATHTDPLRARFVMQLDSADVVNMIDISPYFNPNQTPRLKVLSIRGSLDGIDYFELFDGPVVINPSLNVMPDTYKAQNMYLKGSSLKLAGSGVFVFTPTKLQYIEIIFEQDHPYNVKVGHTIYKMLQSASGDQYERLRRADVPKYVQDGEFTKHTTPDSKIVIEKAVEVFDGWRYSIAIKDIGIYKFKYANISEFRSTAYVTGDPEKGTGRPISKIYLETDELIPEEFTSKVDVRNNYIQYYISFDDQKWMPISPSHRMPFGTEVLPPKLIEINPVRASINSAVNASKSGYESKNPVYKVRLRAVLRRPTDSNDMEFFSPILEEYRIKVELE